MPPDATTSTPCAPSPSPCLILYHWAMLYVGGEDWDWHMKSAHTIRRLQLPMLAVNRWRMDLIFLISGLSVHFLLREALASAASSRCGPGACCCR